MFNMLTKGLYRFSIQLSGFKTNTANAVILRHTLLCSFILCFCILVYLWTHNAAWFYGSVLKVKYVFGDSDPIIISALIFFLLLCVSLSVIVFLPFFPFRTYVWMSEHQHSCALCSPVMKFNPFKLSFIMCVSQGMLATLRCVLGYFPSLLFALTIAASPFLWQLWISFSTFSTLGHV